MNNSAPCKGCTERCAEPNCHTTCQRYIDWKSKDHKMKVDKTHDDRVFWSGTNRKWYNT